jgi:hypothetical protein
MCFSKKLNDKLGKFSPATKWMVGDAFVNPEDTSAQDAAAQEAARQKRISQNVTDINKAYAGRESQYGAFTAALRKQYGTDLGRQQTAASRNLKFNLARGGLTGGSVAVDTGRNLAREGAQATLTAESRAKAAEADLRSRDEQSRLSMISLAQSGNDIGNAAMQTGNALRANIQNAQATGQTQGLGELFGGTAATYKAMQEAAAMRKGLKYSEIYANPFSRGSGAGA